ncbi:MAG: serpin family protein [Solirubrobacteraceae bacterium]
MTRDGVHARSAVGRLPALVNAYARRVYPAVLEQQSGAAVASPLGVWLLLAACAGAAHGQELAGLEEVLGCPGAEVDSLLSEFVRRPPPALKAAIAIWVAAGDGTDGLAAWVRSLPEGVESGFMPTQAEADAWAQRRTLGLIRSFPVKIDEWTRIVLASALATRVSWEVPFDVAPAGVRLGSASPWRGRVSRLLWDAKPGAGAMIGRTRSAGLVAVHCAVAREGLTVISVSADPAVARDSVLNAAHEVAAGVLDDPTRVSCSLYDLPLGAGHSWEISEQEAAAYVKEPSMERIAGVALPAWSIRGDLDLHQSPLFGTSPALQTVRRLIGPRRDDECKAAQAAVASFTRYGFEAAAVTVLGIRAAALRVPRERVLERTAVLRFDHPYAAVAIAGRPRSSGNGADAPDSGNTPFPGLPLFSAWVHEPSEPEDEPPSGHPVPGA